MYELGTTKLDPEKPVYFLCYSGNKCAKTGISVLKDAGFDPNIQSMASSERSVAKAPLSLPRASAPPSTV